MNGRCDFTLFMLATIAMVCMAAGTVTAATVTQSITYQGKLTDAAGNSLTGTYTVTFRLYDVAAGGTALSTDTHSVTATNGLFTTTLTFNPAFADGRALWLGIKAGADPEMTPRQEIRPVQYALGLRPRAWIINTGSSNTLNVLNRAGGTALNISTTGMSSPAIYATTSAIYSKGVFAYTEGDESTGVFAQTMGDFSNGLGAYTEGDHSHGVSAITEGDSSDGVTVYTFGANSQGVNAITAGANSQGVYAFTTGANSPGVSAISNDDTGVYGKGKEGGYFTTNQKGTSYPGYPGVNVSTNYAYNPGIRIRTTGDNSEGMHVFTSGVTGDAVFAYSTGANSEGIYAYSDQANGIYAETGKTDHKYGVYTPDYIWAKGTQYPSSDVAEFMPVLGDITPLTVLIIGDDGRLVPSSAAYDTRVAGIVSAEPGIFLGTRDDGNPGEALIAIAGRVPCRVDAGYGAIQAGDLLTTSDTPGHAMKAGSPQIGTVLGKAMGSLESGTGTIDVLVTLQ